MRGEYSSVSASLYVSYMGLSEIGCAFSGAVSNSFWTQNGLGRSSWQISFSGVFVRVISRVPSQSVHFKQRVKSESTEPRNSL